MTLLNKIVASTFFCDIVLYFVVNVLGNGLEAVGIIERHFGVEWGFDFRVNATVREAKCIEIEMFHMNSVYCPVLDFSVLGLKVCHGSRTPMTTILVISALVCKKEQ
jgi:hypothetical protein